MYPLTPKNCCIQQVLFSDVSVDELITKLKQVPHITVWRKEDIPRKFFYTYNRRILSILIVADDSWQICASRGCSLTGKSCELLA